MTNETKIIAAAVVFFGGLLIYYFGYRAGRQSLLAILAAMSLAAPASAELLRLDVDLRGEDQLFARPVRGDFGILLNPEGEILASFGAFYGLDGAGSVRSLRWPSDLDVDGNLRQRSTFWEGNGITVDPVPPYSLGDFDLVHAIYERAGEYSSDRLMMNPDQRTLVRRRGNAPTWTATPVYETDYFQINHNASFIEPAIFGDSNLDGVFDSNDLIQVMAEGRYGATANWLEGDWNGDGVFLSDDIVHAMAQGGYTSAARMARAVPEPSGPVQIAIGVILALCFCYGVYRGSKEI